MSVITIKDRQTRQLREYVLPPRVSLAAAQVALERIKAASHYFRKDVVVTLEYCDGERERRFCR